ncbi:WD40 repeat domain-containing serine/threonine protein kinase [Paludisphaera soli]|uniref:WD40 repeat domain-containing serine/threonine protein kinase n=1 Tax=Paludisphaera soli TaxID=2712865 RepID=UPI0013EB3049|nr:protein kinase [Paludisphaera soli]
MSEQSTESGSDPEDGGDRGPLSEWLARYDEAMRKGETPPEPRPEAAGVGGDELDRFRSFLDLLDRTLRPRKGAPATAGESTLGDTPDGGPAAASPVPRAIGRFRIEEELGRGGFGIVFRAFDPDMGRWVALKVPKADALLSPKARRRFLGEAHAAAQLDHPNLVPVYEAGEAGSVCYIASTYCEGPTLRAWINDGHAPAEPRRAARMVLAMAGAIEHMHARGLLHCDLKPGNVLLERPADPAGEADPKPRVTDFGLARLADAPVGESTAARPWGTPPYMAPEQIEQRRDAVGPPTDVYALGGILYELLTGRPPHQGKTTWDLMRAVVAEPPTPPRRHLRSIPRDLDAIAMKCLEKRPDRRYPTAAALADDLKRYLGRRPTKARPLGRLRRLARWAARNPTATAVIAMSLATLGVSVAYSLALRRANDAVAKALDNVQTALVKEKEATEQARHRNYVMTLALANQEMRDDRWAQAQRRLRAAAPRPGSGEPDARDFTWHYLWRQSRRDRTTLDELFPGGPSELSTGHGLLVGVDYDDKKGGIWRITPGDAPALATPRPEMRFEQPPPMRGGLWYCQLSTDGRRAVICRKVGDAFVNSILDLESGRPLTEFEGHPIRNRPTILSTERGLFVAGSTGPPGLQIVRREFDLDGRRMQRLSLPGTTRHALSPDGRRIAATRFIEEVGDLASLEIWDLQRGSLLASHPAEPICSSIAASPAPEGLLATGGRDGTVQLREFAEGSVVATLPAPPGNDEHQVYSLAYSEDGTLLAAGYNRRAVLWDVRARKPFATLEGLEGRVETIAFLQGADGDVALGAGSGEVVIWHMRPIEESMTPGGHADEVWGVAYLDGGRALATVGGDNLLKLWDPRSGREIRAMKGHESWPSCLAAAPSEPLLASGDFDGKVLIWDAEAGELLRVLDAHEARVWAVAFSPDGRRLATVGRDRTVRLWDAATWSPIAALKGHARDVRGVAFCPDGRRLVTCGEDKAVIVWDAETGARLREWDVPSDATSLALSPDGRTLAIGDVRGVLSLWDAESWEPRALIPPLHRREISGLSFSPDGRVLAVAGQDGLISLIDVRSGNLTLRLEGHEGGVNAADFSPDGRTLASVSHDKTLRLWWAGPAEAAPPE